MLKIWSCRDLQGEEWVFIEEPWRSLHNIKKIKNYKQNHKNNNQPTGITRKQWKKKKKTENGRTKDEGKKIYLCWLDVGDGEGRARGRGRGTEAAPVTEGVNVWIHDFDDAKE